MIVALGGGHGLAATIRALRVLGADFTAVVSVADDGGSSGRLRQGSVLPALGDLRKALIATAGESSPLLDAMGFRFDDGDLKGHAFGNLLISAFASSGSGLLSAIDEVHRLVGGVGRVLPASVAPVDLCGSTSAGGQVFGQVQVMQTPEIDRVWVDPADGQVPVEVVEAITTADLVILGPGSLYTSVLAVTCLDPIRLALERSSALLVYVSNLRPQEPETSGYSVADHVAALFRHGVSPDTVLYDPTEIEVGELEVSGRSGRLGSDGPRGLTAGHDAARLAEALSDLVR